MEIFFFKLLGNQKKVVVAIFVFITLFCILGTQCAHAANLDLAAGVSFDKGEVAPVLGFDVHFPQGHGLDIVGGTLLWGSTKDAPNNWDWHLGVETCKWDLCAMFGATYVQRIDAFNGTHTNYSLRLVYTLPFLIKGHETSAGVFHISNGGTSRVNNGRDAAVGIVRLQ